MEKGKAIRTAINEPFIKYYPQLGRAFDSICAAILLKQIDFLFMSNNDEPFSMFKEPCENINYRYGFSWTEMLGISKREFDTALSKLKAVKVTKGISLKEAKKTSLVVYWTDGSRQTWYWLNTEMYHELLENTFTMKSAKDDLLYKAEKRIYIEKPESAFTYPYKDTNKDKEVDKEVKPTTTPAKSEFKSKLIWQMEYEKDEAKKQLLTDWAKQTISEQLPRILTIHGKQYTDEQLTAWIDQQLIKKPIELLKTKFTPYGHPLSSDTVNHIINTANWQLTNRGGLDIPQMKRAAAGKRTNNHSSPFK